MDLFSHVIVGLIEVPNERKRALKVGREVIRIVEKVFHRVLSIWIGNRRLRYVGEAIGAVFFGHVRIVLLMEIKRTFRKWR
jgi:hypothetical protein